MNTLTLWIFELLLISVTEANGLSYFPENFVLAKRNDENPVTLTCDTKIDGAVTWKLDGEELEDESDINLSVSDVDAPMLGEYSCWRGNEKLSSTKLLLEAEDEEKLETLITCWAKSYDCKFSCNWTDSKYTAVRLGLGPECKEGGKSCHWVSSTDQDGGFQFELSHPLSPYAEESTMLELTVEAINNFSILRRTKRFYLRDIVQPDSPQIIRCQDEDQGLNVTIDPPSSWSTPYSFFRLEHEIEYMRKDDGKVERSSSVLIPKGISKLRVRSRDSLVLSNWSQWTPWKNVLTTGQNQCKCKNKEKFCCPELPPGYLEECRKRKGGKKNRNKQKERKQKIKKRDNNSNV